MRRSEPAVPSDLAGEFSSQPAMAKFDPVRTVAEIAWLQLIERIA